LQAMAEAESSERFRKAQENVMRWRASKSEDPGSVPTPTRHQRQEEEKMCDITEEVSHLNKIKDIRDELKMIRRVLIDQQTVLSQYRANQATNLKEQKLVNSLDNDERFKLKMLEQSLEFRIAKIDRFSEDAKSVEDSVSPTSPHSLLGRQGTNWYRRNDGH
jgi:hypothetical protein